MSGSASISLKEGSQLLKIGGKTYLVIVEKL